MNDESRKFRTLFFLILFLALSGFTESSRAAVLFQDNFDSSEDWTITQGTSGSESCYADCSMQSDWTAYNTYMTQCVDGITGRPGNNSIYVNAVAGYPAGLEACRGGSGKCLTKWQEACLEPSTSFDDADANLGYDMGAEYEDVYLRFSIKFPAAFTLNDGQAFKLWHTQHYDGGGANPWNYFERDTNNQPVISGGIRRADADYIDVYAEGRGYPDYYAHGFMFWRLGTYAWATAAGGILDGSWHSIEIRQKRNSAIGAADGLIEVWFDGEEKSTWTDYPANDINFNNGGSDLRGWRFISVGGNNMSWTTACSDGSGAMSECEQWYAIDDVVISDQYIGPVSPDTPRPAAPTGLTVT